MRWRRRTKTIQVGILDRQLAVAEAIRRTVDQGYRSPVIRRSERIFDTDGHAVWEVVLSVRHRPKKEPR